MNIVIISTYSRPMLFHQMIESMYQNCKPAEHHLTMVWNGNGEKPAFNLGDVTIYAGNVGASAARNIGASSIPKYRRQKYIMFCDDDCYLVEGWDDKLLHTAEISDHYRRSIVSGHAHPFNHSELKNDGRYYYQRPLVISSVNMMMPWLLWDDIGFFTEPGGAGGSEDYDYCMRAKAKGYGFAVTSPECVLHTGITSSNGKPIVGQKEVMENNRRLMEIHGLKDVRFE